MYFRLELHLANSHRNSSIKNTELTSTRWNCSFQVKHFLKRSSASRGFSCTNCIHQPLLRFPGHHGERGHSLSHLFFFYLSVANHTQSCFRRGLFYVTDSWGFETSFGRPARLWNLLPLLLVSITASHSSSTAGPPLSLFIATVFHTNEPEWLSFVTAGRSRNRGWCGLKCFYSTGLWQWCVTYWRILVFGLCPSPIFGSKLSSVFSQGRA